MQSERQTIDRHIYGRIERWANRQTDRQTGRQADKQIGGGGQMHELSECGPMWVIEVDRFDDRFVGFRCRINRTWMQQSRKTADI